MFLKINGCYYTVSSQDEPIVTEKVVPRALELGYNLEVIHNFDTIDTKNTTITKVSLDELYVVLYNSVKKAKERPADKTCLVVIKHKIKDEIYGFYILPGNIHNIHVTYMDHINLVRLYYPTNQIKVNIERILGYSEWRTESVHILKRIFGTMPPIDNLFLNQILNNQTNTFDYLDKIARHLLVQNTSLIDQQTLEKYGFIKDNKLNKKMISHLKTYLKLNCTGLKIKKVVYMEDDQVTYSLKIEAQ